MGSGAGDEETEPEWEPYFLIIATVVVGRLIVADLFTPDATPVRVLIDALLYIGMAVVGFFILSVFLAWWYS